MKRKNRSQDFIIHLLAACIFLLYPLFFTPGPFGINRIFNDPHVARDFLSAGLMLVFFYANYFYLIPKFYFHRKFFPFALFAFLFLVLIALLPPYLFPSEHRWGIMGPPSHNDMGLDFILFEMGHQFFLFAATLLLSLTIKINGRWRKTEKEKLNAELSYLKAQINPHFLFNTLNSIYSLSIIKSDKTPEAVVKLSGMMRYVLSEAHQERVPLDKEITYITHYIELQQIRLGNTVQLEYTVQGDMIGKEIAPLILISFVENAFKHGVNAEENSAISIQLKAEVDHFYMEVKNNKVKSVISIEEESGLGIENTKNRLNLLYPNKHELSIQDDGKQFSVILKIFFR